MAGDEISLVTGPLPHFTQTSRGGSENRRIFSKRVPHASHWYSYSGIALLFQHRPVIGAEHQVAMQPQRHGPVAEERVVEAAQAEALLGGGLVVLAQLQGHQLAERIEHVR